MCVISFYSGTVKGIILSLCLHSLFSLCFHKYKHNSLGNGISGISARSCAMGESTALCDGGWRGYLTTPTGVSVWVPSRPRRQRLKGVPALADIVDMWKLWLQAIEKWNWRPWPLTPLISIMARDCIVTWSWASWLRGKWSDTASAVWLDLNGTCVQFVDTAGAGWPLGNSAVLLLT